MSSWNVGKHSALHPASREVDRWPMNQLEINQFQKKYLPDFVTLNRQWIEEYFTLEPADLKQLEDPIGSILEPGGEILFLIEGNLVRGTVALVPHGEDCFEVAKMAVDPAVRGRGFGDILMKAAIDWARERGVQRLMLLSNTSLVPAISLYKKHGFRVVHLGPHPDYRRSDIEMELILR